MGKNRCVICLILGRPAVKHAGFFCMQKQGKTKLFAQANSKIAAYTAYTCLHLYICLYINYLE